MKKLAVLLVAALMIVSLAASVSAKDPFAKLDVPKCETAPVIDGVISKGEYKLVATFDKNSAVWNRDSSEFEGKTPVVEMYATWDDTYFYLAVKAENLEPNYTPGPNSWVFQQPSLMTAMVYDDPTIATFASADGKDWDWSAAANSSFSREWTIGMKKDGTDLDSSDTNHFGKMRDNADFKFKVKHGTYDVYEQAIPWAAIAKTEGIEVGGKCGLAFSACIISAAGKPVAEGETEHIPGKYVAFASGISDGKNFERYAQITLTANEPFVTEEETEPTAVDTETESTKNDTAPTGDSAYVLAAIALLSIASAVVVVSKKRR